MDRDDESQKYYEYLIDSAQELLSPDMMEFINQLSPAEASLELPPLLTKLKDIKARVEKRNEPTPEIETVDEIPEETYDRLRASMQTAILMASEQEDDRIIDYETLKAIILDQCDKFEIPKTQQDTARLKGHCQENTALHSIPPNAITGKTLIDFTNPMYPKNKTLDVWNYVVVVVPPSKAEEYMHNPGEQEGNNGIFLFRRGGSLKRYSRGHLVTEDVR